MKLNTTKQLTDAFPTEKSARDHFEAERWAGWVLCPHCGSEWYYIFKTRPQDRNNRYKCADRKCRKQFNCLTGTIFENTKIPMAEWFKAMYLATSLKKGISSYQLAAQLGVTQKTAWFMLHRIRKMLEEKCPQALDEHVEIDETYVGGKLRNKHYRVRKKIIASGKDDKVPVLGIVQRNGNTYLYPLSAADKHNIWPLIAKTVNTTAIVNTDASYIYHGIGKHYREHSWVNHSGGQYVVGNTYTNTIEGVFSHLKRTIYGTYHWASAKHLGSYCSEVAFRYNTRKYSQTDRFNTALYQADVRLKYKDLIGNGGKI